MPEFVNCPYCSKRLRVPDHLLGRVVKCPGCSNKISIAPAEDARSLGPNDTEDGVPSPDGASADEEGYGDEYEEERPRRRRRSSRRAAAQEAVNVPAILLIVTGILGLVMGVLYLLRAITKFNVDPMFQGDPLYTTVSYVISFAALLWGGILTYGGFQMRGLQSRGLVITAAILAMVPCNVCCIMGLPVGIWTLVVVNSEKVKDAFN